MNKENSKNAAGLRRSAIAERIRLREEWSALKGPESQADLKKNSNILTKKQTNVKTDSNVWKNGSTAARYNSQSTRNLQLTNDVLRGVVALVEVGTECRALPLRAALSALGASVLPIWSPLVTHLIWSQGGCRATRARGRALACRLVSPLWVEACAAGSRRLPESAFPAAARASDLPSPTTLRRLLKKAEQENIQISDLLSDSDEEQKALRLRVSTDTERDTSTDVGDTSRDTSKDTSRDTSKDTSNDTTAGTETRVNTAPRRALPKTSESLSPPRPAKSRRKLFTHKEADVTRDSDDSTDESTVPKPRPRKPSYITKPMKKQNAENNVTQRSKRELARAERLARKLLEGCMPVTHTQPDVKHRIVLTGMSREERKTVAEAVRSLGGRVQRTVSRRTTHVLLGSCVRREDLATTGITNLSPERNAKPRTLNALLGAARGARVLYAQWATECKQNGKWLHHSGYEVMHLRKISQKARVERTALGATRTDYAYDVFCGMRVHTATCAQQEAATTLLRVCGAVLVDNITPENDGVQNGERTQNCQQTQNGGRTQNGQPTQNAGRSQHGVLTNVAHKTPSRNSEYDIIIGKKNGEISSKWVFDSVAAGRMRTTRRYVNNELSESELVSQMERFQC